jgi:putative thioredoxin
LKVALADKLLQLDRGEDARTLLQSLPAEERERQPASGLLARLRFADLAQGAPDLAALEAQGRANPADCAARRQLAARYVLAGAYEAALEQFMDLMRRNPQFEDEAGRKGLDRDLRDARQRRPTGHHLPAADVFAAALRSARTLAVTTHRP